MTTLAELQRNFIRDCLSEHLSSTNSLLAKDIDTSLASASGLLSIYQNSSIGNITQAMKLTYPVIEKLVGEDFFRACCKKFISAYWPKSANMDDYGKEFGDFLANFEHAKPLTYLHDVAQLEWLFHLSSLGRDSIITDWASLSVVEADGALDVILLLAPSVKLISSSFPIDKIWQLNQSKASANEEIDLTLQKETLLVVFRQGMKTEIMSVNAGEFALLSSFCHQKTLGSAIEKATKIDCGMSIDGTIKKFIGLNIISGFKIG